MKLKNVLILFLMAVLGSVATIVSGHLVAATVVRQGKACIKKAVENEPRTKEELDAAMSALETCLTTFRANRNAVIGFYLGN